MTGTNIQGRMSHFLVVIFPILELICHMPLFFSEVSTYYPYYVQKKINGHLMGEVAIGMRMSSRCQTHSQLKINKSVRIGCSSIRGRGGELGTLKNLDL